MKRYIASLVLFVLLAGGALFLVLNVFNNVDLGIDKSDWMKISNISSYTIVYDENLSNETSDFYEMNPAIRLAEGLYEENNDWNLRDKIVERLDEPQGGNKIYVCNSSAESSINSRLGKYDFSVRRAANHIRIEGGSNSAILAGVDFFLRECVIKGEDGYKDIYIPSSASGYHYNHVVGANKIEGVDITEFYIVVDDVNEWGITEKAQEIQQKIIEIANVVIPIVPETNKIGKEPAGSYGVSAIDEIGAKNTDTIEETRKDYCYENEILIAGYSSLRSDAIEIIDSLQKNEYYVGVKNKNLLILGDNALALKNACNYFLNKLNAVGAGKTFKFSADTINKKHTKIEATYNDKINIFVDSNNGSDEINDGYAKTSAFKTLSRAIIEFNSLKQTYADAFIEVNVFLLDGNYFADSLDIEVPYNMTLNIKADTDAKPVIDSLSQIAPSEREGVYYVHEFGDEDENYLGLKQVYIDGVMASFAQSEGYITASNQEYYTLNEIQQINATLSDQEKFDENKQYTKYPFDAINNRLYVSYDVYNKLNNNLKGYEEVWLEGGNQNFIIKIVGTGTAQLSFTEAQLDYYIELSGEGSKNMYNAMSTQIGNEYVTKAFNNRNYKIRNSLQYINSSTYVYDNINSKLYFYSNPANKVIKYAKSSMLLNVSNSQNVYFDGLTFSGVDYKEDFGEGAVFNKNNVINGTFANAAAVYGANVTNISFENCTFTNLSSNAIYLTGVVNKPKIRNNTFKDIGMSAVVIGLNLDANQYNTTYSGSGEIIAVGWDIVAVRNAQIINNNLNNIGSKYPSSSAITITKGDGIKILQNSINATSSSAISVGFGDSWRNVKYHYLEGFNVNRAEIAFNHITNYMQVLKDGGAIETIGANCEKEYIATFNKIHDNYVNNAKKLDANSCAYYLNNSSSNWEVYNNVAGGADVGVLSEYKENYTTHNNKIYDMYILINTNVAVKINESDENLTSTLRNIEVLQNLTETVDGNNSFVTDIQESAGCSLD